MRLLLAFGSRFFYPKLQTCICGRCDCEAINEICSRHYANHPIRNSKKRFRFEIGDKVCCTKNATVNDQRVSSALVPLRLCNGEIFFIEDVNSAEMLTVTYWVDYRPHNRGDNMFGSIRVRVCPSVCLWALSCLNCLTSDLDFWHEGRP